MHTPNYRLDRDAVDVIRRQIEHLITRFPELSADEVLRADTLQAETSAFELLDALGPQGGIRALFVMGSNVAVASPDLNRIESRLASLDHLTVCDSFPNETTAYAHVVLPVYQWAEAETSGNVLRSGTNGSNAPPS